MRKGRWFYSCDVSVTWRSQTNTNFKVLLSLAQYIKYGMEFYVIFNAKHVNLGEKAAGEMINNFQNFSGMISSKGGGEDNSTIKQLVRCATSLPGFFYSGCFQVSTMVLNLNDMAVVISWSHKSGSHANFKRGTAMGSAKQSEQEPKRRYDFPRFIRSTITPAPWKGHRQHLGRTADVYKLLASTRACLCRAFLLTWPAVIQIHCNKRKFGSV